MLRMGANEKIYGGYQEEIHAAPWGRKDGRGVGATHTHTHTFMIMNRGPIIVFILSVVDVVVIGG